MTDYNKNILKKSILFKNYNKPKKKKQQVIFLLQITNFNNSLEKCVISYK